MNKPSVPPTSPNIIVMLVNEEHVNIWPPMNRPSVPPTSPDNVSMVVNEDIEMRKCSIVSTLPKCKNETVKRPINILIPNCISPLAMSPERVFMLVHKIRNKKNVSAEDKAEQPFHFAL